MRDAVFAVVPAACVGEHHEAAGHRAPQLLARLGAQFPIDLRVRALKNRGGCCQQAVARAHMRIDWRLGRVIGDRFGVGHRLSCSDTMRRHRITALVGRGRGADLLDANGAQSARASARRARRSAQRCAARR